MLSFNTKLHFLEHILLLIIPVYLVTSRQLVTSTQEHFPWAKGPNREILSILRNPNIIILKRDGIEAESLMINLDDSIEGILSQKFNLTQEGKFKDLISALSAVYEDLRGKYFNEIGKYLYQRTKYIHFSQNLEKYQASLLMKQFQMQYEKYGKVIPKLITEDHTQVLVNKHLSIIPKFPDEFVTSADYCYDHNSEKLAEIISLLGETSKNISQILRDNNIDVSMKINQGIELLKHLKINLEHYAEFFIHIIDAIEIVINNFLQKSHEEELEVLYSINIWIEDLYNSMANRDHLIKYYSKIPLIEHGQSSSLDDLTKQLIELDADIAFYDEQLNIAQLIWEAQEDIIVGNILELRREIITILQTSYSLLELTLSEYIFDKINA